MIDVCEFCSANSECNHLQCDPGKHALAAILMKAEDSKLKLKEAKTLALVAAAGALLEDLTAGGLLHYDDTKRNVDALRKAHKELSE